MAPGNGNNGWFDYLFGWSCKRTSSDDDATTSAGVTVDKVAKLEETALKGECIICFEEGHILSPSADTEEIVRVPASDHVAPVCSNPEHLACVGCMVSHIRQQIDEGKAIVLCPADDCNYVLSRADRTRFTNSIIEEETLNINQSQILTEGLVACPGQYQDAPCPAKYDISPDQIDLPFPYTCATCETRFCLGCLTIPAHPPGRNCRTMRAATRYELSDIGHTKAMKATMIRDRNAGALCQCGVIIQRTEGCNHMTHHTTGQAVVDYAHPPDLRPRLGREERTVRACDTEFCYVCRSIWEESASTCFHYDCNAPSVNCLACSERAVRFQVGTEHYICKGTPTHEFCRTCCGTWDQQHEDNLSSCPTNKPQTASTTTPAAPSATGTTVSFNLPGSGAASRTTISFN